MSPQPLMIRSIVILCLLVIRTTSRVCVAFVASSSCVVRNIQGKIIHRGFTTKLYINDHEKENPSASEGIKASGLLYDGVVWVEIIVPGNDDERKTVTSIEVNEGDFIDTIKKRIKTTLEPMFESVSIVDIELYKSKESESTKSSSIGDIKLEAVDTPLDPRTEWNPNVTWGTKQQPLIVYTPTEATKVRYLNALKTAIKNHFAAPSAPFNEQDQLHLYNIDKVMGQQSRIKQGDTYWNAKLTDRFKTSSEEGVLYRPKITIEIYDKVADNLKQKIPTGLIIKGPHGIGKSHSIVNVVRKLQSTGNYLVTYIPDCDDWSTTLQLVDTICSSFGASFEDLELPYFKEGSDAAYEYNFDKFINLVASILQKQQKQWIFVFDQINRIFARYPTAKDIGVLPFPFSAIKKVMRPGRITTIISASANNELSYKDEHEGFEVAYVHPTVMTEDEMKLIYPGELDFEYLKKKSGNKLNVPKIQSQININFENIEQLTRNVPLYVDKYLTKCEKNPKKFLDETKASIGFSIVELRSQMRRKEVLGVFDQNMIQMLLLLEFDTLPLFYDRKYFVKAEGARNYYALVPMVETLWRESLWDQLLQYVTNYEAELIVVYKKSDTTQDTKGRLFESIVIQRCIANGIQKFPLSLVTGSDTNIIISLPQGCNRFSGNSLMTITNAPNGVHIPINSNFPAIDMIWKSNKYVIGVQVHTSADHKDNGPQFEKMCSDAGWFNIFQNEDGSSNVFLIYLCPDEKSMVKHRPKNASVGMSGLVQVGYITVAQVECLRNLLV